MVVDKLVGDTNNTITYRDIGKTPIPHINHQLVESFYKPTDLSPEAIEAGQRSEMLINEFLAHDLIVIGVPMYNYTIPSTLKSYIDHLARPGYTFKFTPDGSTGLVKNKRCIVVITRVGELSNSLNNHQETYLETMFNFLGIEEYEFIVLEGLFNESAKDKKVNAISEQLEALTA